MHDDDEPIGRILGRREALAVLGASGLYLLAGGSKGAFADTTGRGTCVARPRQTEGPYFVDERLNRSDIRGNPPDGSVRPGARLDLTFNVSRIAAAACAPLAGAIVDVWHCDSLGVYSDVVDPGFNTTGQKFLRGYQTTDSNGQAKFTTIYPGWYEGRAVHIHFKIRSALASPSYEFTSQLYFDDGLTDQVHAQVPYSAKRQRTMRNSRDRLYNRSGSELLLATTATSSGYTAAFDIGLQI